MAELTPQERLQPSLLDRLRDDEPDQRQEGRDKGVLSLQRLREVVLRDIAWLLNATNFAAGEDIDAYPEVQRSVLNYGLPDLSGRTASGTDPAALERSIRDALLAFEPRILRHSLQVRLSRNEDQMSHNAMTFDIEGELWAQPIPLHVYVRTEIDLDVGDVRVSDRAGSAAR
jgi:type VI secretion system protein ImpF